MHKGSCLCGSIRYELSQELGDFGHCHCKSCRKASGTAYATNAPVDRAHFHLVGDGGTMREYESSPGKFRAFCSRCGSPIYAYVAATPDILRIRLGALDTPFSKRAKAHTWISDKADWDPVEGALPQFPRWAPRSVLDQKGTLSQEV